MRYQSCSPFPLLMTPSLCCPEGWSGILCHLLEITSSRARFEIYWPQKADAPSSTRHFLFYFPTIQGLLARCTFLFPPVNGPCPAKRMKVYTDVARLGHCFCCGAGWACFGTDRVLRSDRSVHHRVISQSQALFACWDACPSGLRSLPQKPNECLRYCPRPTRKT